MLEDIYNAYFLKYYYVILVVCFLNSWELRCTSNCVSEIEEKYLKCFNYKTSSPITEEQKKSWESLDCNAILKKYESDYVVTTKPIIFHSHTGEGLISQLVTYRVIWNWAFAVNRSIVIHDFMHSNHLAGEIISICRLFDMPKSIACSNSALDYSNCVIVGKKEGGWASNPDVFKLPKNFTVCENFNILTAPCIGAYLSGGSDFNINNEIYPPKDTMDLFEYIRFSTSSLKLLEEYLLLKKLDIDELTVIHWRRGDQLGIRCSKGSNDPDHSINCGTVQDFLLSVKRALHNLNIENRMVYIATNERDPNITSILVAQKFIVSSVESDFLNNSKRKHRHPTYLQDGVMLDLMLLCRAKVFVGWGNTRFHDFAMKCRRWDASDGERLVTLLDDKLFRR